jgi:chorismate synthase
MKIERDAAEVTSGVRHGFTLGGPIALTVANRDYANWEERMNPWPVEADVPEVHLPRPGHADLAGSQKYGFTDVRNVLERGKRPGDRRSSGGRRGRQGLPARPRRPGRLPRDPDRRGEGAGAERPAGSRTSPESTPRPSGASIPRPARRWSRRSTCCASATSPSAASSSCAPSGSCPGLGSHVSWESRLDGLIGMAMLSIQAVKGCGIGDGFDLAGPARIGAHDEIFYDDARAISARPTARAESKGRHEHG